LIDRRFFVFALLTLAFVAAGGDRTNPDMHGLFIAAGPSFAEGVRVAAFENI